MSRVDGPDLRGPAILRNAHHLLWDLNNLLLIPVFSIILVDVLAAAFEIPIRNFAGLEGLNLAISGFFFLEWALGLALSGNRVRYLRTPARVADLVSSIPLGYLLQSIRLTRAIRVLRLLRVVWRMHRVHGHLREVLRVAGLVVATAMSGAAALHMIEPQTVPSFGDALWWSVVTMSTVGYGDISPESSVGRAVAATMILLGIAIFGYALSVLTSLVLVPESNDGDDVLERLTRIENKLDALTARLNDRTSSDG